MTGCSWPSGRFSGACSEETDVVRDRRLGRPGEPARSGLRPSGRRRRRPMPAPARARKTTPSSVDPCPSPVLSGAPVLGSAIGGKGVGTGCSGGLTASISVGATGGCGRAASTSDVGVGGTGGVVTSTRAVSVLVTLGPTGGEPVTVALLVRAAVTLAMVQV